MLNILYAANENYVKPAAVSMVSLLENNKEEDITIYFAYENVCAESLEMLKRQVSNYGQTLVLVDGMSIIEEMGTQQISQYRGSWAANFRLHFEKFVDSSVKRMLYLDCDTIINASLKDLFSIPMDNRLVAAVHESLGYRYKKFIGFQEKELYFNSGVLLFNVERWREKRITEHIILLSNSSLGQRTNPDQDVLNIALKDECYILHPKYNLQPFHMFFSYDKFVKHFMPTEYYYSQQEVEEACASPVILHTYRFCGRFPWYKDNIHPAKRYYQMYKKCSLWNMSDDIQKPKWYFMIESFFLKLMPKSVFLFMYSFMQRVYFYYKESCLKTKRK